MENDNSFSRGFNLSIILPSRGQILQTGVHSRDRTYVWMCVCVHVLIKHMNIIRIIILLLLLLYTTVVWLLSFLLVLSSLSSS